MGGTQKRNLGVFAGNDSSRRPLQFGIRSVTTAASVYSIFGIFKLTATLIYFNKFASFL